MTRPAPSSTPSNIVQWGFDSQYQDNSARAEDAFFGAGSFLADDGKTAQIPDYIAPGEKWFNDGVWKDHFIPTAEPDRQRPARRAAASSGPATWP